MSHGRWQDNNMGLAYGTVGRFAVAVLGVMAAGLPAMAGPPPSANAAFDAYVAAVDQRLAQEYSRPDAFTTMGRDEAARLRRGESVVERLASQQETSGAMLHDWRGTAFAPGATVADFEKLMRDADAYPKVFSPEVLRGKAIETSGDHMKLQMRVRQHHVITVVMDTDYDVRFGHPGSQRGYCTSTSTRVAEISAPGTANEHALSRGEEHGFLWRLNSYWSYEERDGGLYMRIEAVSLTRAVPHGLGWMIGPYVESIPRESLEFTLHSVQTALSRPGGPQAH